MLAAKHIRAFEIDRAASREHDLSIVGGEAHPAVGVGHFGHHPLIGAVGVHHPDVAVAIEGNLAGRLLTDGSGLLGRQRLLGGHRRDRGDQQCQNKGK